MIMTASDLFLLGGSVILVGVAKGMVAVVVVVVDDDDDDMIVVKLVVFWCILYLNEEWTLAFRKL